MKQWLSERRIILAVCGGIAAYKCCELVRLLRREGADVRVVMTESATRFVTPLTFEALSGHPVSVSQWASPEGPIPHITLASDCDLVIVAPATANMIAKAACGIADDLVSTMITARHVPVALVPAMNSSMWGAPANQRNIRTLQADGFLLWGPAQGSLACGESGAGRMLEPREIAELAVRHFAGKPLRGRSVLITAGPTYEPVDPVRGLTNRSSGAQGFALASAAARAGASVTVVSGPCAQPTPADVRRIDVTTASEMLSAVLPLARGCDIFIGVAAVCDWRPLQNFPQKLKKEPGTPPPVLELEQNDDILAAVGHLPEGERPFVVGFAAETRNLLEYARGKLTAKNADMIVANLAQEAVGAPDNTVVMVTPSGERRAGPASKEEIAQCILEQIAACLPPDETGA